MLRKVRANALRLIRQRWLKMEAKEVGRLDTSYDKLVCHEAADEDCPGVNQGKQKVSMSMVRPTSILYHQKVLVIALAVLASVLLVVDIGLGVYYAQLSNAPRTVQDIKNEIAKMKGSYMAQIQQRDKAKQQLQAMGNQKRMKSWEHEHLTKRIKDYQLRADLAATEVIGLEAHLPLLKEGCRHCQPGWHYIRSSCFFFSFLSDTPAKPWEEARNYCQQNGATLVVVDSREKQLALNEVIYPSRSRVRLGIWIGLDDMEEEGIWRWPDRTRLVEGFWNDGEPNNLNQENCVEITVIRENPFKSWNDCRCTQPRNWICEKAPTLS
ncbi:uncharacterized protein ACB058_017393 isoform 1-T2 [Synchiropus picturatus]